MEKKIAKIAKTLIIKSAYKDGNIVLMDRTFYLTKCYDILLSNEDNYVILTTDPTQEYLH